ncbi:hypothetical protein BJX66DRAFT_179600 [Aspergillus keveii]|uniref:Uncharacterized protein n=1 Tax=Aspergillus keveii TaxID=714993 RepID=A0ABR4FH32_9EURO
MLTDQITLHLQNNLERLPIRYWNKHIVVCGAGYKMLSFKYVNSCCENPRRGTVSAIYAGQSGEGERDVQIFESMEKASTKKALEDGIHIAWGRQRMTTSKATSLESDAKETIPGQNACKTQFSGGERRQTKPRHFCWKFEDKEHATKQFHKRVAKKKRLGYLECELNFERRDLAVPISGIRMSREKENESTGVFVEQRRD